MSACDVLLVFWRTYRGSETKNYSLGVEVRYNYIYNFDRGAKYSCRLRKSAVRSVHIAMNLGGMRSNSALASGINDVNMLKV